jgi:hypothetical protein
MCRRRLVGVGVLADMSRENSRWRKSGSRVGIIRNCLLVLLLLLLLLLVLLLICRN